MFLIKLKTMGNCIIPDLNNFIIFSGNNTIIDLEEYCTKEQIQNSMQYNVDPHLCGNLKQLLDVNIIELVRSENIEWKAQVRQKKQEEIQKLNKDHTTNRQPILVIIKQLKQLEPPACIEMIENEFFDNISILEKIMNDKEFPDTIQKLAKKYYDENLNQKIDKSFILI